VVNQDLYIYYSRSFAAEHRRCQLALVQSACSRPTSLALADSLLRVRRTDDVTVTSSPCQHGGQHVDSADYVTDDDDDDGQGTTRMHVKAQR